MYNFHTFTTFCLGINFIIDHSGLTKSGWAVALYSFNYILTRERNLYFFSRRTDHAHNFFFCLTNLLWHALTPLALKSWEIEKHFCYNHQHNSWHEMWKFWIADCVAVSLWRRFDGKFQDTQSTRSACHIAGVNWCYTSKLQHKHGTLR